MDENSFKLSLLDKFFKILLFLNIPIVGISFHTLHTSPTLTFDPALSFPISKHHIQEIEGLELAPTFFLRLPEFLTPQQEVSWWQMQERVYQTIIKKPSLSVELKWKEGMWQKTQAVVGSMSIGDVVKRIGLVYLTALIYMISAITVFKRHHSSTGLLLSFFLLAGSIYFFSSAPVVYREITLVPSYFKILVSMIYISAGGLITLVHFALLFPQPKGSLQKYPLLSWVLYGYFMLVVVLYLTRIIAFGTTLPFFCFWTLVMMGAFIHSLIKEKDPFLRKQVTLSFFAPSLAGGAFIFLYLFPGFLGDISTTPFTHFALISLVLPFALPLAMDNLRLYQERLAAEKTSMMEMERIRQELHDSLSNDLTSIRFLAEVSEQSLPQEPDKVVSSLRTIKNTALKNMERLRDFLWAIDLEGETLKDMVSHFRFYASSHLDPQGVEVEFNNPLLSTPVNLNPLLRFKLFSIYKEAITNIVKHSKAKKVKISLSLDENGLEMRITDDGVGFNPENNARRCYGIGNMRKRSEDMGAVFSICSEKGKGTEVHFILPKYLI